MCSEAWHASWTRRVFGRFVATCVSSCGTINCSRQVDDRPVRHLSRDKEIILWIRESQGKENVQSFVRNESIKFRGIWGILVSWRFIYDGECLRIGKFYINYCYKYLYYNDWFICVDSKSMIEFLYYDKIYIQYRKFYGIFIYFFFFFGNQQIELLSELF